MAYSNLMFLSINSVWSQPLRGVLAGDRTGQYNDISLAKLNEPAGLSKQVIDMLHDQGYEVVLTYCSDKHLDAAERICAHSGANGVAQNSAYARDPQSFSFLAHSYGYKSENVLCVVAGQNAASRLTDEGLSVACMKAELTGGGTGTVNLLQQTMETSFYKGMIDLEKITKAHKQKGYFVPGVNLVPYLSPIGHVDLEDPYHNLVFLSANALWDESDRQRLAQTEDLDFSRLANSAQDTIRALHNRNYGVILTYGDAESRTQTSQIMDVIGADGVVQNPLYARKGKTYDQVAGLFNFMKGNVLAIVDDKESLDVFQQQELATKLVTPHAQVASELFELVKEHQKTAPDKPMPHFV